MKILSTLRRKVIQKITRVSLRLFIGEQASREEMYGAGLIQRVEDIERLTRRAKTYAHLLSIHEMIEEFRKDYQENAFIEAYVFMLEKGVKDKTTVIKLNMRDKRSLVHSN